MVDALQLPDEELLSALDAVINLEKFYEYWALETLVWHHDGFSGNTNNFYMYADPTDSDRFRFLPWGTDHSFHENTLASRPDSVQARSLLHLRLYDYWPARARYYEVLDRLLDEVWNEEELLNELDPMQEHLLRELPEAEVASVSEELLAVRAFINARHTRIDEGRADGDPELPLGVRTSPCLSEDGSARFDFTTTWGSITSNIFNSGSASANFTFLDDEVIAPFTRDGSRAGQVASGAYRAQVVLRRDLDVQYTLTITAPEDHFRVGTFVNERGPVTVTVSERDLVNALTTRVWELTNGTLRFDEIEQVDGSVVQGYVDGTLYLRP